MLDFDLERMLFKIPKDKHNKIDIANILKAKYDIIKA